jgi:uncharacterized protein YneF (UPF0154 family)
MDAHTIDFIVGIALLSGLFIGLTIARRRLL